MKRVLAMLAALVTPALASAAPGTDAAKAERLIAAARSGEAYALLQHLTDRIGPRLSGSPGAEAAVQWSAERLRGFGLEVRTEPVQVPRWVRGVEEAAVVSPASQRLVVTALGGSVPTSDDGVTAELVEVASLEELEALGQARVRGRIVLFNRAIPPGGGFAGYGAVAPLRGRGPSAAARLGAVATLVRSLGTGAARLPHTGGLRYADDAPRIPAAAVTAEDAELLHRLLASGGAPVTVRLRLGCRTLEDAPSANVVADLRGRERPDEIVLIGAHLDSWDLGTGAIDDGAGVAMVMETLRLVKSLGLAPRRTLRAVLFMNEENGLRGGRAYAAAHTAELERHVAAIESDAGGARPLGFSARVGEGGLEQLRRLAEPLAALGADHIDPGGEGGADISVLAPAGVPLLGLNVDATHYFDWHHTAADTLDKVDANELAEATAALAAMAFALADAPEPLPRPAPDDPRGR